MLNVIMLSVMAPILQLGVTKKVSKDVACILSYNQGTRTKGERLGSVDFFIKIACFCKKGEKFSIVKAADLNELVQGGQM
jgi:hypothetical protein